MTTEGDVFIADRFVADAWTHAVDGEPLPDGAVFLSKARFLAEKPALIGRTAPLGLLLDPADRLDDLADDIARFAAIAVRFPRYGDGRGYSLARLLRERHGFTGELRAVGDVLWDQLEAFRRVGFDALVIEHAPTRARLADGERPASPVWYQPAIGRESQAVPGRPWLRVPYQDA